MANTQELAPNLSQYFANDPPSLFDEINDKGNSAPGNIMNENIPQFGNEPEPTVTDDVKDMWEPAFSEPGVPPLFTMPGVLSPNDLVDPIRDAVKQLLGEEESNQRRVLTADDVTQDERGLRQLIDACCFRSAINLTSRLLTIYGQGYGRSGQPAKHTPHSLQLWFTRFSLLIKLRQFELCQSEAEPFGALDRPDLYYQFYPEMYSGRKGSMVGFSFRLLMAEFPSHLGGNSVRNAMDRLTDLAATCHEIKVYYTEFVEKHGPTAIQLWQRRENRVLHSLCNCALQLKDFHLVDEILGKLIAQDGVDVQHKRALFSAWGRTALQRGDIIGAEKKFAHAMQLKVANSPPDLRDMVDGGLVAVAQNEFQEAYGLFQKGLALDPTNTMILNNMGGCLLYCGKLKDAIIIFENAVFKYPKRGLNEHLILNLSTLYELESSNSWDKKLMILKQINRYKPDLCVNLDSCLKLQTGC